MLSTSFIQPKIRGLRLSKSAIYGILACTLISCDENIDESKKSQEDNVKHKVEERISKIQISQFGRVSELVMDYDKDVVSIELRPSEKNVDARVEFNPQGQIREIISGANRIQYLYNDKHQEIGIFTNDGMQQIMFEYAGGNIEYQFTINGNDTIGKFRYQYENGLPSVVEVVGAYPYYRKYELEYSDIDNALTGFNELVLPSELVSLLGIPAIYGEKYLKRAVRIDDEANSTEPLQESYTPSLTEINFDIAKSGKQETLKLTTDGSRQWSAIIHWY